MYNSEDAISKTNGRKCFMLFSINIMCIANADKLEMPICIKKKDKLNLL